MRSEVLERRVCTIEFLEASGRLRLAKASVTKKSFCTNAFAHSAGRFLDWRE